MLLSKPVIAAIEGHAVAGGLELALWCDLRVVARDATLGVYCRQFGVPLIDLGTIRLPLDLILTGRGVSGEEALRMGLANRLVESGDALPPARELARLPAFRGHACGPIGSRAMSNGGSLPRRPRATNTGVAWRCLAAAKPWRAREDSRLARGGTDPPSDDGRPVILAAHWRRPSAGGFRQRRTATLYGRSVDGRWKPTLRRWRPSAV